MIWLRTALTCCVGLTLLTPALITGPGGAKAQGGDEHVLSDTPEYCHYLLDKVSTMVRRAHTPPPDEVTQLSTEGQRMCDHGQTRPGILRLRRAVVLLQETEPRR